jgi:hypothetical protein
MNNNHTTNNTLTKLEEPQFGLQDSGVQDLL